MAKGSAKAPQDGINPWGLLLLFVFLAGIRIAYALRASPGVTGDAILYIGGAHSYLKDGPLAVPVNKGPFYSITLGFFAQLLRVDPGTEWLWSVVNAIMDLLSLALLYRIGKRIVGSSALAGIALVAASPLWWGQFNIAASEDLAVLCFLAFFERWTRPGRTARDELWAGIFASLLTLTRAVYLLFPLALLVFERAFHWLSARIAGRGAPKGVLMSLKASASFLAASYALPLGWALNGYVRDRSFVLSGSPFQPVMMAWLAMNVPDFDYRLDDHRRFWDEHPFLGEKMTAADVARMKAEVLQFVQEHPLRFIGTFPIKVYHLWIGHAWNPFSYIWIPRYLGPLFVGCFTVPVLVLGLAGTLTLWKRSCERSPGFEPVSSWRASCLQLAAVCYITLVTLPLIVEARFGLQSYVALGLWAGLGFKTLFLKENRS